MSQGLSQPVLTVTQCRKFLSSKDFIFSLLIVVAFLYTPVAMGIFVLLGMMDLQRSRPLLTRESVYTYFIGSGRITWALAPLNLLCDLFSLPNRYVYQPQQLPVVYQEELRQVLDYFRSNEERIKSELVPQMAGVKKGMIFYRWYGKDTAMPEELSGKPLRYVQTIGISVFNSQQATRYHYGPLRATLRVLCNLSPEKNDDIYITTRDIKHYWHDDPLFIFDDTLLHRSVNGSDKLRYCLFIDIVRPTFCRFVLMAVIRSVQLLFQRHKKMFYKNWKTLH